MNCGGTDPLNAVFETTMGRWNFLELPTKLKGPCFCCWGVLSAD